MIELTELQRRVLNGLIAIAKNGVAKMPMAKLAKQLDICSQQSMHQYLRILAVKGYIQIVSPEKTRHGCSYKILKTK